MKHVSSLLAATLLACAGPSDPTQSPPPPLDPASFDDIGSMLEPLRAQYDLPALAGAVVEGDTVIALGATGVRKLGVATGVSAFDRFHLGSCTKAMTSTLLGMLVEDGTLDWTTPLNDAFPQLAGTMHPDYQSVTLEQLIAHWGGTWRTVPPATWSALWQRTDPLESQRAWFAQEALTSPPEVTPGTQHLYSNTGYMIVGAAMERATGETWEALMTDRLFAPLGMASCGFGAPGDASTVDEPWGHGVGGGGLEPRFSDNPAALGPAGTVHCNLTDWAKFASLHIAGARGESTVLPAASWDRMHTAWPGGNYAHGWLSVTRSWAGGDAVTHTGSNTLWYATVWVAPEINRAFLAATNSGQSDAFDALDDAFGPMISEYAQ